MATTEQVAIGKLGRPHGVRGEIRLFLFNPASDVLEPGMPVTVTLPDGDRALTLEQIRPGPKFDILKFEGLNWRDQVESLTNGELFVAYHVLPDLEEGEFYHVDLLGLPVHLQDEQGEEARTIGHIDRFFETGANDVLVVKLSDDRELFVPMTEDAIIDIDLDLGRVVVAPLEQWAPEGTAVPNERSSTSEGTSS